MRDPSRSFIAFLLFAGILLSVAPPAGAVTIDPGVVLRPADSWADVSFAEAHSFSSVTVGSSSIAFDAVTLQVEKVPRSVPLLELTITSWDPRSEGSTPVRFLGELAEAEAIAWFNLTGLLENRAYVVLVDGSPLATQDSGAAGRVSFRWSSWSVHDFVVRVAGSGGGPPVWEWLATNPVECGLIVVLVLGVVLIAFTAYSIRRRKR